MDEVKKEPIDFLSDIKQKVEDICSDFLYNQDGKRNTYIGFKLGALRCRIIFEERKKN